MCLLPLLVFSKSALKRGAIGDEAVEEEEEEEGMVTSGEEK